MLKRFGLPVLALASALAVAAPSASLAADRDDHRGGREVERHDSFKGRDDRRFARDDHHFDRDRGINFGFGFNSTPAPAPAPTGYYDQFGVWHPYGFYDARGVWHPY